MKNINFLRLLLFFIFFVTISSNNFAETMFKDNFQEPNHWNYVADTVMGGISTGGVEFKTIEGEAIAVLTGNVTTENNGGFIQIRRDLRRINLDNANSIKLIEWPQLIEINITDVLELHLSYSTNENERDLILKGRGKWKEFNLDEL